MGIGMRNRRGLKFCDREQVSFLETMLYVPGPGVLNCLVWYLAPMLIPGRCKDEFSIEYRVGDGT